MNFRAVTCLVATVLLNVFIADATFQRGYEIAAPPLNGYDRQASAQNLYSQVEPGYPSGAAVYNRQFGNPVSSSLFSSYPSNAYPASYAGNGIYAVPQEESLLVSLISTIKNCILRIVVAPFKVFHIIKEVISTIIGLIVPGLRRDQTIGYSLV